MTLPGFTVLAAQFPPSCGHSAILQVSAVPFLHRKPSVIFCGSYPFHMSSPALSNTRQMLSNTIHHFSFAGENQYQLARLGILNFLREW